MNNKSCQMEIKIVGESSQMNANTNKNTNNSPNKINISAEILTTTKKCPITPTSHSPISPISPISPKSRARAPEAVSRANQSLSPLSDRPQSTSIKVQT